MSKYLLIPVEWVETEISELKETIKVTPAQKCLNLLGAVIAYESCLREHKVISLSEEDITDDKVKSIPNFPYTENEHFKRKILEFGTNCYKQALKDLKNTL